MKTWIKSVTGAIVTLALLLAALLAAATALGERKMARKITVPAAPVELTADAARIAHGRYLFTTRGCAECHGENGAGATIMDAGGARVISPNITTGPNSATARYTVMDWVRTLRHGVKPDGTPVMIMPSEDYNRLSNEDTAALVSYVLRLPPVAGKAAVVDLPWAYMVQYGAGAIRDAAEKIDHALPPAPPQPAVVSASYGAYVANSCMGCHGATFSGGKIPGAPPEWPAAANLTPGNGSAMAHYASAAAFKAMLRSGRRPDGSAVNPAMPFASLKAMNDVDIEALHAYLRTLPPRPTGQH